MGREDMSDAQNKPKENLLFDIGKKWQDEWQGMPEYKHQDLTPFKTIYVHFNNKEDLKAFATLVNQTITCDTDSIWYPEAEIGHYANKCFIEESEEGKQDEP
jgi:hypothetical protein